MENGKRFARREGERALDTMHSLVRSVPGNESEVSILPERREERRLA